MPRSHRDLVMFKTTKTPDGVHCSHRPTETGTGKALLTFNSPWPIHVFASSGSSSIQASLHILGCQIPQWPSPSPSRQNHNWEATVTIHKVRFWMGSQFQVPGAIASSWAQAIPSTTTLRAKSRASFHFPWPNIGQSTERGRVLSKWLVSLAITHFPW